MDHKPLLLVFHKTTWGKTKQRHISLITEYIEDVLYVRREDNVSTTASQGHHM